MFVSPKIFFEQNLSRTHKFDELMNEYDAKLNIFLQEYFAIIHTHFHDKKWNFISFFNNELYNHHFLELFVEFVDDAQEHHTACLDSLNNSLSVVLNNANTRIRV